jgi:hypothetical protein
LGMDVCVSVLCCPVSVEALCRADPPSKESYQNVSICRSRSPLEINFWWIMCEIWQRYLVAEL